MGGAYTEHEGPDGLVPLKEAALHVAGQVEGEKVDDVLDAPRRERRLQEGEGRQPLRRAAPCPPGRSGVGESVSIGVGRCGHEY